MEEVHWALSLVHESQDLFQTLFIILISAEFFIPMRQLGSYFHIAMNGMAASDKLFGILEMETEAETRSRFKGLFPFCIQSSFWLYGSGSFTWNKF